jgi:hypothetical protein
MKPWGMTAAFQIVKPTRAQDAISEAVEEAFRAGMTPAEFISEAQEFWGLVADEQRRDGQQAWARIIRDGP